VSGAQLTDTISSNLAAVRARIARAAARSHRPTKDVRLIAVSKTFGADHVRAAFAAGQHDFGENRVQEALEKIGETADLPLRWHLIGHLQSNKARRAVGSFACIHSVDSSDLLRRLDAIAREQQQRVEVLVQVDLAGEVTKFGTSIETLDRLFADALEMSAACVVGLMTLPPFLDDPEQVRPYFRRLRELRDQLSAKGIPPTMLRELSMGMSNDFEVAIEEGATLIRLGTAIFGSRG
jgi:pyridoxal phosphate enzyme (YggS family)